MGLKSISKLLTLQQALANKIQKIMAVFYTDYSCMLECTYTESDFIIRTFISRCSLKRNACEIAVFGKLHFYHSQL